MRKMGHFKVLERKKVGHFEEKARDQFQDGKKLKMNISFSGISRKMHTPSLAKYTLHMLVEAFQGTFRKYFYLNK